MPLYFHQVYCIARGGWAFAWNYVENAQLESCPDDPLHGVRSTQLLAEVHNVIRATHENSPFTLPCANVIIAADTTAGDVVIEFPVKTPEAGSYIIITKPNSGDNSVLLVGGDRLEKHMGFLAYFFDGTAAVWQPCVSFDAVTDTCNYENVQRISTCVALHDTRLGMRFAGSVQREWAYEYRLGNAKNNGPAIMGTWQTLPFNLTTASSGAEVCLRAENGMTTFIAQPGKYRIVATQSFYKTERTSLRLFNTTLGETVALSKALFNPSEARIDAIFSIGGGGSGGGNALVLQYRIDARGKDAGSEDDDDEALKASGKRAIKNGLGKACGFGEPELYTELRLVKLL